MVHKNFSGRRQANGILVEIHAIRPSSPITTCFLSSLPCFHYESRAVKQKYNKSEIHMIQKMQRR